MPAEPTYGTGAKLTEVARQRLATERKAWRKDHPFGFVAKPASLPNGETDWAVWRCSVPGKKGTDWEGGMYPVTLTFTDSYPSKPPACHLPERFFHPNVYPSGKICLSIINEEAGWKPSITIKQILMGIQELLENPNVDDPAQEEAWNSLKSKPTDYRRRVRHQATKFVSDVSLS